MLKKMDNAKLETVVGGATCSVSWSDHQVKVDTGCVRDFARGVDHAIDAAKDVAEKLIDHLTHH